MNPRLGIKNDDQQKKLLTPSLPVAGNPLRYYQEIAINRVIQTILKGQHRVLINMATGTGKTDVAFHICWKLWSTRWNRTGEPRRPRILYLSDRSMLVDDPKDKQFAPFSDARWKIQGEMPDFLLHQFCSPFFVDQCMSRTTGAHYPAINDSNLRQVVVIAPSLAEQHLIVKVLDKLQTEVDALKSLQADTTLNLTPCCLPF